MSRVVETSPDHRYYYRAGVVCSGHILIVAALLDAPTGVLLTLLGVGLLTAVGALGWGRAQRGARTAFLIGGGGGLGLGAEVYSVLWPAGHALWQQSQMTEIWTAGPGSNGRWPNPFMALIHVLTVAQGERVTLMVGVILSLAVIAGLFDVEFAPRRLHNK